GSDGGGSVFGAIARLAAETAGRRIVFSDQSSREASRLPPKAKIQPDRQFRLRSTITPRVPCMRKLSSIAIRSQAFPSLLADPFWRARSGTPPSILHASGCAGGRGIPRGRNL